MSRIFKQHQNKASLSSSEKRSFLSLEKLKISERSLEVSASELSYLTAQVWSLENRLREETQIKLNLMVGEKLFKTELDIYKLLFSISRNRIKAWQMKSMRFSKLTRQKQLCEELFDELQNERENNCVLMGEIECLQEEVDKNRTSLEKTLKRNLEFKESLVEANETINQMGLMYMKLKDRL